MIGAIAGDIFGFPWERHPTKDYNFTLYPDHKKPTFSDDTILTVAVANSILNDVPFVDSFHHYGKQHMKRGFGKRFKQWLKNDEKEPYGSYGNGSAMRVSPIAWLYPDLKTVLQKAEESASVTHNHPEGIKGAKCVAHAAFLALQKTSKDEMKEELRQYYPFDKTYAEIQPEYKFDVSCQGSVSEAIVCFLESESYEDAIRKAVALGGDSDTQASIAGALAEAYYGCIPPSMIKYSIKDIPDDFFEIVLQFYKTMSERRK